VDSRWVRLIFPQSHGEEEGDVMEKMGKKFVQGAIEKGIGEKVAGIFLI
jgi:hypothetical protein